MIPSLTQLLHNPDCYPHPVSLPIQVIETQVSWVLLTGEFAYKFKKEIYFGFLDFSTLAKRQFYCEEELRLNQRLAPDIYQAVVAIQSGDEHPIICTDDHRLDQTPEPVPATGQTLEYAVRMLQFDHTAGLDQLMQKNQFEEHWIDELAEQLALFHQKLPTVASNSPWGTASNIWQLVSDNYIHTLDFCQDSQDLEQLAELYGQATEQYSALLDVFQERRNQGFIRECHGDLHLGNVTLYAKRLRLFDCIEFNLQFRWIDTCADLAFLLMDLEACGKYAWANRALNRYLEITGDYQCLLLLDFYKCFRSMVRAKVATLGSQADQSIFQKYLHLSQSYQIRKAPKLILMHGLSGSGKSYLSAKLLEHSHLIRIRSRTQRRRLYIELQKKGKNLELYGPEINARLSQHLLNLAEQLISQGYTVVVDGTFLKQHFRQKYINLAKKLNTPMKIISCYCEHKLMEARLIKSKDTRFNDKQQLLQRLYDQQLSEQPLSEAEVLLQHKVYTASDLAIQEFISQFEVVS